MTDAAPASTAAGGLIASSDHSSNAVAATPQAVHMMTLAAILLPFLLNESILFAPMDLRPAAFGDPACIRLYGLMPYAS